MKKKMLSVLLCSAMVVGMIAGCSGGSSDGGSQGGDSGSEAESSDILQSKLSTDSCADIFWIQSNPFVISSVIVDPEKYCIDFSDADWKDIMPEARPLLDAGYRRFFYGGKQVAEPWLRLQHGSHAEMVLAGDVYLHHGTMMRSLLFDYMEDEQARKTDQEFLFGKSLLICPVTEPMYYDKESRELHREKVWKCCLPGGDDWYHFWTDRKYTGGQSVTVEAPLDQMPIFVKAGSILPMKKGKPAAEYRAKGRRNHSGGTGQAASDPWTLPIPFADGVGLF